MVRRMGVMTNAMGQATVDVGASAVGVVRVRVTDAYGNTGSAM
jgi:hypothetical protein